MGKNRTRFPWMGKNPRACSKPFGGWVKTLIWMGKSPEPAPPPFQYRRGRGKTLLWMMKNLQGIKKPVLDFIKPRVDGKKTRALPMDG